MSWKNVLLILVFTVGFIVVVNSVPSETPPVNNVNKDQNTVDHALNKNNNGTKTTVNSVTQKTTEKVTTAKPQPSINSPGKSNETCANCSIEANNDGLGKFIQTVKDNKDMLLRTFYVLIAVTSVVVLYFLVRAWRVRRRKNKSRKYGLITSRDSDLEMAPLDADDDDEDMTVFQMNNRRK